jgi:hypothetical protein
MKIVDMRNLIIFKKSGVGVCVSPRFLHHFKEMGRNLERTEHLYFEHFTLALRGRVTNLEIAFEVIFCS